MKIFHILSLFPEQVECYFKSSIIFRAIKKGIIDIKYWQLRDFAIDKHSTVDDNPYGGGKGMVIKVDVVDRSLTEIKEYCHSEATARNPLGRQQAIRGNLKRVERSPDTSQSEDAGSRPICRDFAVTQYDNEKPYIILTSPKGKRFNQNIAKRLSKKKNIVIICGHYEGFDARVERLVDEKISIGDFVLSGGEIAAAAIIDSVARLVPGVLSYGSLDEESFNDGKLEYPQYTRPEKFTPKSVSVGKLFVPKILLTGNHGEIKKWREENR